MAKSKFFRVAVEGATTDGREIERGWIQQMASTYNRAKYGARVFAEHIRGMVPDGPFRALGDVLSVKAEEITDDDELKGKLALYAQIEPTPAMVQLIRSGQKIYSSIEIDHNFAGTKLAYLTGLGITDSPASLGTEVLTFAAQNPEASPFRARKQRPENLFSAALETAIELDEEAPREATAEGVFAKLSALLDKFNGGPKPAREAPASTAEPTPPAGQDFADLSALLREFAHATTTQVAEISTALEQHQHSTEATLASFREMLNGTEAAGQQRPPATGGSDTVQTDC